MTFRMAAAVLVLVALASGMIVWRGWRPGSAENVPSPGSHRVLKLPADTEWKSVPEPQLREWLSFFEAAPHPRTGKERVIPAIETLVANGETVVTEGYESEPGMFVFTTITPTLKTLENGTEVVHVEARSFELGLSGAFKIIATFSRDLYSNESHTQGMIMPSRIYHLHIQAKADAESGMIKMTAQGESNPIDPPLPAVPVSGAGGL